MRSNQTIVAGCVPLLNNRLESGRQLAGRRRSKTPGATERFSIKRSQPRQQQKLGGLPRRPDPCAFNVLADNTVISVNSLLARPGRSRASSISSSRNARSSGERRRSAIARRTLRTSTRQAQAARPQPGQAGSISPIRLLTARSCASMAAPFAWLVLQAAALQQTPWRIGNQPRALMPHREMKLRTEPTCILGRHRPQRKQVSRVILPPAQGSRSKRRDTENRKPIIQRGMVTICLWGLYAHGQPMSRSGWHKAGQP